MRAAELRHITPEAGVPEGLRQHQPDRLGAGKPSSTGHVAPSSPPTPPAPSRRPRGPRRRHAVPEQRPPGDAQALEVALGPRPADKIRRREAERMRVAGVGAGHRPDQRGVEHIRVIGVMCDWLPNPSGVRSCGTRPRVCSKPTTPQHAAGMRLDPPPSVPTPIGPSPAATAAAAPPPTAAGPRRVPRVGGAPEQGRLGEHLGRIPGS